MSFLKKLFGEKKQLNDSDVATSPEAEVTPQVVRSRHDEIGLSMEMDPGEEEIVKVIAASIFAENQLDTKLRVRSITKIDPQKEVVAVIAASIAAGEYPDTQFRLVSITEA